MFKLFGRKADSPEERLAASQRKRDYAGLARAYYEMGKEAMDRGDRNGAVLWLHRADTVYSARDDVYEKVGEKLTGDCSDRIGALEEDPLLYNAVPAQIEEKAEELSGPQVRVWGLLSAARLVRLGERLAKLPGCEVLGELGWAVEMMRKSLQAPPSTEEYQRLMDICDRFYALGDSEAFYGGGEIDVPGKAPFQVFDLNGMMVPLELNGYIDSHLRLLSALSQGSEELPAPETGVVGCALLPDYYVRTLGGKIEAIPPIRAELDRIGSDYDFVRSGLTWEQVQERAAAYQMLDILA